MSETTTAFQKKVEELKTVLNKRKREEVERKADALQARQKDVTQSIIEIMDPYEGPWDAKLCDKVCEKLEMEKEVVKKAIKELQSKLEKLEEAIKKKDVAAVRENIDLARLWVDGYYLFQMAVEANSLEIVTLFEQYHKIEFGPVEFLNLAIEKGFTEIVNYFLKTYDYTVESDDEVYEYDNPLLEAVKTKDEKMVSLLLKYGSIYLEDGVKGTWHPSFYDNDDDDLFLKAVESGVTSIVKMLIDAKIDVPASESHEMLLKVIISQEVLNLIVPYISVSGKRNLRDREKVYKLAKAKRRYAFGDLPEGKKAKLRRDPVTRRWFYTPNVKVLEAKKEVDKDGPHCINEKYYVKVISDKTMEVIDVSGERLQMLSWTVDMGLITDVVLWKNYLLVGISCDEEDFGISCDEEDFETTQYVKRFDLEDGFSSHFVWDHKDCAAKFHGPVLRFGFCNGQPYVCCKKRLVFPVTARSFDFGDLEAGSEVLIAMNEMKVFNLKKGDTYYTRTFVNIETYPALFSDKEQSGAYASIDSSGRYTLLLRPHSERYFIRDLELDRIVGHVGFEASFVAKIKDGFFVQSQAGDSYGILESKNNYHSKHVRMKQSKHMAAYDDGGKVTCMKMVEYDKLETFIFPEA